MESDYELLDSGFGRRLERFGDVVLSRPAPAAVEAPRSNAPIWKTAQAEFRAGECGGGAWVGDVPDPWWVQVQGLWFELRPTKTGQVGLFPEQRDIRERVRELLGRTDDAARVLDLFGATGGTSVTAALAGAKVTLVDASKPTVAWARRNFERNGCEDSIRSIAEDVRSYVAREVRRGSKYEVILLDPPSFGHGLRGSAWKIERDLPDLLNDTRKLLSENARAVIVTAHSTGWKASRLRSILDRAMEGLAGGTSFGPLAIPAASGTSLPAGVFAWRSLR